MRILLINPNIDELSYKRNATLILTPPMGLASIASFIMAKRDDEVSIIDAYAKNLSLTDIMEIVRKNKPDVVGFTTIYETIALCIKLSQKIKKFDKRIKIIFGGIQASVTYSEILSDNNVDFIVIGEGEETFLELLNAIESKNSVKKIKGIAFRYKGRTFFTGRRKLIKNLDLMPFPARHLFDNSIYFMGDKEVASITCSRGCFHNCTFCAYKIIFGRNVRLRSVNNIIDEIRSCIKSNNTKVFFFWDAIFGVSKEHSLELCQKIIKNKFNIPWTCRMRVDTITDEPEKSLALLRAMKSAGCFEIKIGVESGSQEILDKMKKDITLSQIEKAISMIKDNQIKVSAEFIMGNFGETKDSLMSTIKFAKRINADQFTFYKMKFYPGTELFNLVKGMHSGPFFPGTSLSENQIDKLIKKAYVEVYTRPKLLFKVFFSTLSPKHILRKVKYIKNVLFR